MAAVVTLTISGVVIAQDGNTWSPNGCDTNGIEMTLSRTPTVVQPGDVITYTLTVSNPVLGPGGRAQGPIERTFTVPDGPLGYGSATAAHR
jgi:hypothetical protein